MQTQTTTNDLKNQLLTLAHHIRDGDVDAQVTARAGDLLLVARRKSTLDDIDFARHGVPAPDRRCIRGGKVYRWACCWEVVQ